MEVLGSKNYAKGALFDPTYRSVDITDRILWAAQRVEDGTLTRESFENFVNQLDANMRSELTAGRPKPFAKGRAFELWGTYDEMTLYPGHHFEMENRITFPGGDVEFDLKHTDPTTGKFDAIEFKNSRIGDSDIQQLQKIHRLYGQYTSRR